MADYPPAPPSDRYPGARRPGFVTAAGVLLVVGGAWKAIVGLLILLGVGVAAGARVGALFVFVALIILGVAALQLYAGTQVLGLRPVGRTLGSALAVTGMIFQLLAIRRSPVLSTTGIMIDAFVFYSLYTNERYFTV